VRRIYLDCAATTPTHSEALKLILLIEATKEVFEEARVHMAAIVAAAEEIVRACVRPEQKAEAEELGLGAKKPCVKGQKGGTYTSERDTPVS
jgi:hypothetical protein